MRFKASGDEISGLGAPLRTATTMPEWATTVTLSAAALPFFTRLSIPCRRAMTTSADSPSWARFTVAPPVANEIASLCPVARSNFGPRSSMTDCIPKALSTLSSAASALIPSTSRNVSPILTAATIERIFIASSCEMVNLRHAPTAPGHSFVALVKAPRTLSSALGGWIVDDTFGLVYSESSFRGVEYDEHVVPGVGYDGAEAYPDLERTLRTLPPAEVNLARASGTESTTRSVSIGLSP